MMKKKLSGIMIFMLLFQFVSGIWASPVGAAIAATPGGITISTHVYGQTVLGQDTIVYITTKNTSGAWAYNVGIQLVLDDGLQISSTQSPAPTSTTGISAAKQTVYWQDIKDLAAGESFEFPVKVNSLDRYRIGNGQVPFKATPAVTVNVHASANARVINDPPNGLSATNASSPQILTIMPFSITVKNPSKQVKGAGTVVDVLAGHLQEWGEGKYEYTILNNTRYATKFNTLTSLMAGSLEAYGFTGSQQPSSANTKAGTTQRSSQWIDLTVGTGATEILTFKAAFLNNINVLNNTNNDDEGPVLTHGSTVSNTIQYNATVNNVAFNSVSDNTNTIYNSTPMDIIINKSVDKTSTYYGDILTYTLTITTNEYYKADNIVVTDIIGNGQTFGAYGAQSGFINSVDGAPAPDAINARASDGTTTFTWHIGTMQKKQSVTLKYTTTVDQNWTGSGPYSTNPIYAGDSIENWTKVSATTVPSGAVSDSDWTTVPINVPTIKEEITSVNNLALVSPSTNRAAKVTVGDKVNFKLTYDATGVNAKQHNVVVYDFLPLGTLPISSENINGTIDVAELTGIDLNGVKPEYVADLHALVWTLPDLPETTTTLEVNVPVIVKDNVYVALDKSEQNLAVLSYKNSPGWIKSERDSVKLEYVEPNIGLSRKIDTTIVDSASVTVNGGQTVLVSVYLKNNSSTSTAYNVKFVDILPPELINPTVISDVFTQPGNSKLAFTEIPSIAPGGTITLKYTATVINPIGALKTISEESTRDYYSQPAMGGRHYSSTENSHVTMNTQNVLITKNVVDSTSPSHGANDVQVGDKVIYKVVVTVLEGEETYNASITDTIPLGQSLLNVYAFDQYTPSTHTPGTPINGSLYTKIPGTGSNPDKVRVPQNNTYLNVITGVNALTPTYTYFIETKVDRIVNSTTNPETQGSKAQFNWEDKVTSGTQRSNQSNNAQVIVSKPNLSAVITQVPDVMQKSGKKEITFTLQNIGKSMAYDFVPTITLPQGFEVDSSQPKTPTPTISGDLINGYTLTYSKQNLAVNATANFVFTVKLIEVRGSGSSHHIVGNSNVYYSTHESYLAETATPNSVGINEKFSNVTAQNTIKVPGVDITNIIDDSSNGQPGSKTEIRPGDLLNYKLSVTVPSGTIAYNLVVKDTLPDLAKFDVIGADLDGSTVSSVTSTTYEFSFSNEVDASVSQQTKVIILKLRAKTDSSFTAGTVNITSSAVAKWDTAALSGETLTTSPASTNTIAVIRPILAITAFPVVIGPVFKDTHQTITVKYTLTNTGVGKAYGTKVEVPILPGLAVVAGSIQADGVTHGSLSGDTDGSGGKVTWTNLTVNGNASQVLSFDVKLSSASPLIGAGAELFNVEATLKQYESLSSPLGLQTIKTYSPNQLAAHTLSVDPIILDTTVSNNTYGALNTTTVRPGDQLTYTIKMDAPDNSTVYHPILKTTDLIDQEIISVKQGNTVINLTDGVGYKLTLPVIGKTPITNDSILTVVTRVKTNTVNPSNPHDTSFKPTIAYKTADSSGSDKTATVSVLTQSVIEPALTLQITKDLNALTAADEKVTYTVTVSNATGLSAAFNSSLDLAVSSKVYLFDADGAANINDSVVASAGVNGNGTIQWKINQIPAGGSVQLHFRAAAKDATTVTSDIYGEATLKDYYSLPTSVSPGDGGKKYSPLVTNTATGLVSGYHALVGSHAYEITAGKESLFTHTLTNHSGGRDTFTLSLDHGLYPTDLYIGSEGNRKLIATGSLVNEVWKWIISDLNYSSDHTSSGQIIVSLAADESLPIDLNIKVPVTTHYDNNPHITELKAVSKYYNSSHDQVTTDTLTIIGTPLDGWVGELQLYNASGIRTATNWINPVLGHNDSFVLQAVAAVDVRAVKASYTVNSVTYSVYLELVNEPTKVNIGQTQWTGVSRLPFSVTEGVYGVNFVAYDKTVREAEESQSHPIQNDNASMNVTPGTNNYYTIRESLTIQGTITKYANSPLLKIEGAKVVLFDVFNNRVVGEPVYTNSNGFYSFPNVKVSEYELRVSKEDLTNPYTQSTVRFYALPPENVSTSIVTVDATLSQSQYHITIKANPSTILGDGVSFTTLTAIVSNDAGETLPDVPVVFSAIKGHFGQFDPNHHFQQATNDLAGRTVVTNSDGVATILLQSELISGTASVRFPVGIDVNDPNHGGGLYADASIVMTFDPGAIVGVVTETVKNADGTAVSKKVKGAIVKVSKKDSNGIIIFSAEMTTEEDGAYKIAIPIGKTDYDIIITKPMLVGRHTEMVSFPQVATAGEIDAGFYREFPADKTGSGLLTTKSITGEETILPTALATKIRGYLIDSHGNTTPITVNSNGTFNQPNLAPGTYQFTIAYENGLNDLIIGSKLPTIIIGDASNPLNDGEMNIALGLIDPYGKVTDASNGLPIAGAHVTLYYADTVRNQGTPGHTPNTPVNTLPTITGFAPFENANPEQITLNDGQYAWMVFDQTDYYVVTTKPGYYTDISPILSVDGAIVMYNPKLTQIPIPAAQPGTLVAPITQTQEDLAVQILSDRAAYPEDGIVTFTIHYLNKSDVTVKGAAVTAQIPQYTDIFEAAGGITSSSNITWTLGDLAPKAAGTIIYKVKVKANSLPQAEVKVTNEAIITATDTLVNLEDDKSPLSILLFTSRFGDQGHERYIKGYPDGNFKPNRAITRAEIAAIFSRIMDLQSTVTGEKFYTDITPTFWAKEYIETATRVGLFTGYEKGDFRPDAPITRAELSTVIFRYLKLTDREPIKLDFTDIEIHWAKNAIEEIYRYHIITGYPDKTFRPGADMIRTEAVTMINRLLNRGPLYGTEVSFPDVNASHWAFGQVEESAITHEYKRYEDGSEQMTKYIPEPLW